MKIFNAFAVVMACGAVHAAALEQVIVRQQWPWSTDVKVEYKLLNVTTPVNLTVKAYNGATELPLPVSAITGDLYGIAEDGVGTLVIDPVKAFGTEKIALANFKVKLTVADAPESAEVLYRIYDMSTGTYPFPKTDVTRADLLNGKYGSYETDYSKIGEGFKTGLADVMIWTGVTNSPEYKTSKLVLRKVKAKDVTWKMGATGGNFLNSSVAEMVHDCTLKHDYFIGIYPVTQEQYRRLAGSTWNGSIFKGNARPVENAAYAAFRSVITGRNATNFVEGVAFDYPTEAQWEYACRAGSTAELYTGTWLSTAALDPISWNSNNSGNETHEVGLKLPNAFGLYDMIGNVYEACSDNWAASTLVPGYSDGSAVEDPTGVATADPEGKLVIRGGAYSLANILTTSAGRNGHAGGWSTYGFRLCCVIND